MGWKASASGGYSVEGITSGLKWWRLGRPRFSVFMAAGPKTVILPSITFIFSQCLYEGDLIEESLGLKDSVVEVPERPELGWP